MKKEDVDFEKTVELAEKMDITKFDIRFLKRLGNLSDVSKMSKKDQHTITLLVATICQARNKGTFTEKEFNEQADEFYIHLIMEVLIREGKLQRNMKWTYKNGADVKYKMTDKGTKSAINMIKRKAMGKEKEDTKYIG